MMRSLALSLLFLEVSCAFVPASQAPQLKQLSRVSYTTETTIPPLDDLSLDSVKQQKAQLPHDAAAGAATDDDDLAKGAFQKSLQDLLLSSNAAGVEPSLVAPDPIVVFDAESVVDNVGAVLAASEMATREAEASLTAAGSLEAILEASKVAIEAAEAKLFTHDIGKRLTYSAKSLPSTYSAAPAIAATTIPESYAIREEIVTLNEPTTSTTTISDVPAEPEPTSPSLLEAPGVRKILRFAIPAIGVWLCGPLLSLIDTGAVGLLGGTIQQAALNPAVAVTDYSALLLSFLFTGSTNLIAASQASDQKLEGSPRTTRTLIGALQLSAMVGTLLGAATFAGAPILLRSIIGNDSISPAVFDAALKYVRIRALGVPAAAVIGSAQAACLGMQDVKSPLYVLATAAIVNFVGDVMFVGSSHPWIGGAAGAAWATVFSQFAALSMFLHWLTHRPKVESPSTSESSTASTPIKVMNVSTAILELTGKPASPGAGRRKKFRETLRQFQLRKLASLEERTARMKTRVVGPGRAGVMAAAKPLVDMFRSRKANNASDPATKKKKQPTKQSSPSFTTRGFLDGTFRPRDLARLPDPETFRDFAPYVVPVTSTVVGRVSGFVAMSHVVSSAMGTASMAAQQVILSFFQCICPIADSLSLTAQSFVPGIVERESSSAPSERSSVLRQTKWNFFKASAGFGIVMAVAVGHIPLVSGWFSSDPGVVQLINGCVPLLAAWFSVHGVMCASEGLLLGQKDLTFLGRMYAVWFAVVPALLLRVKAAALRGCPSANLSAIWQVFLMYQFVRSALWALRAATFERRPPLPAPASPETTPGGLPH